MQIPKLLFVALYLLGEAYACDTPEKIAVALGNCPFTCNDICGMYPECSGTRASCKWTADSASGKQCPYECVSDCSGIGIDQTQVCM